MKKIISFILIVNIMASFMIIAAPTHAEANDEILIEAARNYCNHTSSNSTKKIVDIDHYDGDNAVIHIYEIVNDHTATYDWYTVDRNTGIGTDFFGNRVVLDLPLSLEAYENFTNEDLLLIAEQRWVKQFSYMYAPFATMFELGDAVNHNGTNYWLVLNEGISSFDDIQTEWGKYFTKDFVAKEYYLSDFKEINGKIYSRAEGVGGDVTIVSTKFDHITHREQESVSILVKETREDWNTGNQYVKEFIYTMVWENNGWKLSEAKYTDGTPYFARYGLYDKVLNHSIIFDDKISIDIDWGLDLFNKNASEYDHRLAMAGLLLSRAAYDGADATEQRLKSLGFCDYYFARYRNDPSPFEPGRSIAAQKAYIDGKEKVIITVVLRGTSNIVPDWTTNILALVDGFDNAASEVMKDINDSMKAIKKELGVSLTKDNTIFYITGHSQGGAISGLLSDSVLSYAAPENIFTYTFASPNYDVDNNDASSYTNVHNIINTDDFVPQCYRHWNIAGIFGEQGFKRYGHDWWYDRVDIENTAKEIYAKTGEKDSHATETYLSCLLSGLPKNMGEVSYDYYIKPSDWAVDELNAAINEELIPESLQTDYKLPINRLNIAEIIINLIEKTSGKNISTILKNEGVSRDNNAFNDTDDEDVLAANALGIINGVGDNRFNSFGTLTRGEITAIINRTARLLGVDTNGYSHAFSDVYNHWCDNELGWPTYAGIINGVGDNRFAPDEKLTTEQAIAIFYRAFNKITFKENSTSYFPVAEIELNGHTYALYDYEMSWTDAKDFCEKNGGYLATITGYDESNIIKKLISNGKSDAYWLGATSNGTSENQFEWITDEQFTYTDWHESEPSYSYLNGEKEAYLEIRKSYNNTWNDVINTNKTDKGFILEKGNLTAYEDINFEKAYADVIMRYKQSVEKNYLHGEHDFDFAMSLGEYAVGNTIGYTIKDINQSGVPEFIAYGTSESDDRNHIIAIYSLQNMEPYNLVATAARAPVTIRKNGMIVYESGGSMDWRCAANTLEKDDKTLTLVEEYGQNSGYYNNGIVSWYRDFGNGREYVEKFTNETNRFINVPYEDMELSFDAIFYQEA